MQRRTKEEGTYMRKGLTVLALAFVVYTLAGAFINWFGDDYVGMVVVSVCVLAGYGLHALVVEHNEHKRKHKEV